MSVPGFVKMHIHKLAIDPSTRSPIVILQDKESGWLLPIWVGIFEAHAIAMKMEALDPARPMTHDLLYNLLDACNGQVERVEVNDLIDNTYFATIHYQMDGKQHAIDARPSDAFALAVRSASPIYVANHVLERSKIDSAIFETDPADTEKSKSADSGGKQADWNRLLNELDTPSDPNKLN